MVCLILFAISNVIFSRFLEKKKMHLATIAHAVFFVYVAFAFLIAVGNPFIDVALTRLFGEATLEVLRRGLTTIFFGSTGSAALLLEALSIVLTVLASGLCVQDYISYEKKTQKARILSIRHSGPKRIYVVSKLLCNVKFYRLQCVMRC